MKGRPMRRTVRIIVALILCFLLLWLVSELALPPIASRYVKREIDSRYPEAGDVSVSVSAFPAVKLAFKKYDDLEVEGKLITIEGILFDSIKLRSDGWPGATYRATIGPQEINRFFTSAGSFLLNPEAGIVGDVLYLSGTVQVGSTAADVKATGTLRADVQDIFFMPVTIEVSGVTSTQKAIDQVNEAMSRSPVFVIREDVPFTVSEITVRGGKLVVDGTVDLEDALDFEL